MADEKSIVGKVEQNLADLGRVRQKRPWLFFLLIVAFIVVGGLQNGASTSLPNVLLQSEQRIVWLFNFPPSAFGMMCSSDIFAGVIISSQQ